MSTTVDGLLHSVITPMNTDSGPSHRTAAGHEFFGPSHLDERATLQITHAVPAMFPIKSEATLMPASLHVPMPDVSVPANVPSLSMLDGTPSVCPAAPELLPQFSIGEAFSVPGMDDSHVPVPALTTIPSTTHIQPHLPSSARYPIPPSYGVAPSSLQTAVDVMRMSMDSPRTVLSNGLSSPTSEHTLSSISGKVSQEGAGFGVPSGSDGDKGSPEAPDIPSPHHVVVQDLFQRMNKISQSALDSCAKGDSSEAIPKITQLMQLMMITGSLVLDPPAPSLSDRSPPHDEPPFDSARTLNTSPSAITMEPVTANGTSYLAPPSATEVGGLNLLDVQGSRKRCASSLSIGDDRVNKALKREPQDELPISLAPLIPPVIPDPGLPPALYPVVPLSPTTMLASQQPTSFSFVPPQAPSTPPSPTALAAIQSFQVPQPSSLHQPSSFTHMVSLPAPSIELPPVAAPPPSFPSRPGNRSSWSENPVSRPQRQLQHSYSAGSLALPLATPPAAPVSYPPSVDVYDPLSAPQHTGPVPGSSMGAPIGRVSRANSLSHSNTFPNTFPDQPMESQSQLRLPTVFAEKDESDDGDSDCDYVLMTKKAGAQSRPQTSHGGSSDTVPTSNHNNDIPQEVRADVDRIFFEYLNKICSDLEATDAKGERIHQTLMAKKMQRLDESPDFRPFKFRIAAFTHGFLEELARHGYPEDKIPMKKVRNYLWSQPHIVRYNGEGKKVKSKGNHTWNMEAKRMPDGTWRFREFHRQLSGPTPAVGYVGLHWSWSPRIWHPQGHPSGKDSNVTVQYSSPSLPSWLSWTGDILCGVPAPGAESCDVVVEAKLAQDGHEETLRQTIHITIAPCSLESSFSTSSSRRPSLHGEMNQPRRVASDPSLSVVANARSPWRPTPQTNQEAQVLQVLTSAAQRVAQVAQSQVIASPASEPPGHQLQSLAKQQHVLTVTAQAVDRGGLAGELQSDSGTASNISLAVAAQHVVLSAARQVVADHSAAQAAVGIAPSPQSALAAQRITVDEVSAATQSAVAKAVEITGPLSTEVQVLMTAGALLQWQTDSTEAAIDTATR